jgi:hypothetical protein
MHSPSATFFQLLTGHILLLLLLIYRFSQCGYNSGTTTDPIAAWCQHCQTMAGTICFIARWPIAILLFHNIFTTRQ